MPRRFFGTGGSLHFEWLERACAGLTEMKADPLLKGLRSDRRYLALLQKMRLPL